MVLPVWRAFLDRLEPEEEHGVLGHELLGRSKVGLVEKVSF